MFATQPESLRQVYAYCPVPRVGSYYEGFSATGKTLGLYRFDTRDNEWKVVSTQYDFVDVYVADDKAMFSIVMVSGVSKDNNQPYVTARVLASKDSGGHWKDISNWGESFQYPARIRPDPDHKGLICLECRYRSGDYFMQASDESYQWKWLKLDEWRARHPPDWTIHSSGSWYHATLSNYFDYPFGNRPELPPFQITVKGPVAFKRTERVVVPIEVTAPGEGETLVDTDRGDMVWSLNRTLPDGSVETVTVPMEGPEERVSPNGIYRVPARKAVRPGPAELKLHRVGYRRPYTRSLDLSAMCDFSKPGKYCVRLFYDNGRIADGDKGEWVGTFSGPEFDINVAR